MNLTLNIWVVLYTCGFVMGLFLAALFIVFRKRYSPQTGNVTAAIFVLSLLLLGEIFEELDVVDHYPAILTINTVIDLLIWPFVVFYVQHITGKVLPSLWLKLFCFLPFLFALVFQAPVLILSPQQQLAYYSSGITTATIVLVTFKMLTTGIFLLYIFKWLSIGLESHPLRHFKNRRREFLTKARGFFIGIGIMVLTIYLLFYLNYFQLFSVGDSDRIGSLIVCGFFYFFAALVFQNPQLFQEESYSKQIIDFFKGNEPHFVKELLMLFEDKKMYLNEKLSLGDVADGMNLTNQQLSYLVNRHLGIPFADLVNHYRVEELKRRLVGGDHIKKSLLGIATECGFNSKASFNRIFKDQLGISPSEYMKRAHKGVSN